MSELQKQKLREAQLRYIAEDPRWEAHRAKLAAAQQDMDQRTRLSAAQLSYMASDPRWPAHRERLQEAALEATKLTLLPEEIVKALELRRKGRKLRIHR